MQSTRERRFSGDRLLIIICSDARVLAGSCVDLHLLLKRIKADFWCPSCALYFRLLRAKHTSVQMDRETHRL